MKLKLNTKKIALIKTIVVTVFLAVTLLAVSIVIQNQQSHDIRSRANTLPSPYPKQGKSPGRPSEYPMGESCNTNSECNQDDPLLTCHPVYKVCYDQTRSSCVVSGQGPCLQNGPGSLRCCFGSYCTQDGNGGYCKSFFGSTNKENSSENKSSCGMDGEACGGNNGKCCSGLTCHQDGFCCNKPKGWCPE